MDQKAMEEAARAAGTAGFQVGHVSVRLVGGDMLIKCIRSNAEEEVKGYSDGNQPQKFVYQPTRPDGR